MRRKRTIIRVATLFLLSASAICTLIWVLSARRDAEHVSAVRRFNELGGVFVIEVSPRRQPNWVKSLPELLQSLVFTSGVATRVGLDLALTDVGTSDLAYIEHVNDLRWLDLSGTAADDTSLSHICSLSQLEWLDVSQTRISWKGVQGIKTKLPSLVVKTTHQESILCRRNLCVSRVVLPRNS